MIMLSKDQIFSLSPETENSGKIFSSNWNTKTFSRVGITPLFYIVLFFS